MKYLVFLLLIVLVAGCTVTTYSDKANDTISEDITTDNVINNSNNSKQVKETAYFSSISSATKMAFIEDIGEKQQSKTNYDIERVTSGGEVTILRLDPETEEVDTIVLDKGQKIDLKTMAGNPITIENIDFPFQELAYRNTYGLAILKFTGEAIENLSSRPFISDRSSVSSRNPYILTLNYYGEAWLGDYKDPDSGNLTPNTYYSININEITNEGAEFILGDIHETIEPTTKYLRTGDSLTIENIEVEITPLATYKIDGLSYVDFLVEEHNKEYLKSFFNNVFIFPATTNDTILQSYDTRKVKA